MTATAISGDTTIISGAVMTTITGTTTMIMTGMHMMTGTGTAGVTPPWIRTVATGSGVRTVLPMIAAETTAGVQAKMGPLFVKGSIVGRGVVTLAPKMLTVTYRSHPEDVPVTGAWKFATGPNANVNRPGSMIRANPW